MGASETLDFVVEVGGLEAVILYLANLNAEQHRAVFGGYIGAGEVRLALPLHIFQLRTDGAKSAILHFHAEVDGLVEMKANARLFLRAERGEMKFIGGWW